MDFAAKSASSVLLSVKFFSSGEDFLCLYFAFGFSENLLRALGFFSVTYGKEFDVDFDFLRVSASPR